MGSILFGIFLVCLLWERLRPLRPYSQAWPRRLFVNLSVAGTSAIITKTLAVPLVLKLSQYVEEQKWGLLQHLPWSGTLKFVVAIVLLDYSLYLWHRMNHKSAFLWRFHNVHHIDMDLDVTTTLRFHFGELILSSLYRSLQIIFLGVGPLEFVFFEASITGFALVHHSNFRLPLRLEKILCKMFVTPRMHGVHHSIVQAEADSNFSTILNVWDRFHKTLVLNVKQSSLLIGVPGFRSNSDQSLLSCLLLPFSRQRAWKLEDGSIPIRIQEPGSQKTELVA